MRIGLYGYGKMGKVIEQHALKRGHTITQKVGSANALEVPKDIDVAIEFSIPQTAMSNMGLLIDHGIPVVVGTTGWYDKMDQVKDMVGEKQGALLYASNFSIGVNLFFRLNKFLTGLMNDQGQYTAKLVEEHHTSKLDAPSGTALTLARDLILQHKGYSDHSMEHANAGTLAIEAVREADIPGTHRINWKSDQDEITIEHKAFGRDGFALGAIYAAEWLFAPSEDGGKRKGLFTFEDVLSNI